MLSSQSPSIYTVSRLNQTVRLLLEQEMGQVWISGEISNFTQPSSGHWYFTLKDDTAQVRCAMFRNSNRRVTFRPQNGQQVLVRASVTLYEPRGDYQLIAESITRITAATRKPTVVINIGTAKAQTAAANLVTKKVKPCAVAR